ncbi:unnamed protein product [Brachionus calyciflorus]|uniref:Tudor domain-containing protein n=1 Tax=Brachionus calyciflorus TaxID=104777 RepID=A0A813PB39_9BILA|nr:unnamed protein product [Brachionus calyciflorus]
MSTCGFSEEEIRSRSEKLKSMDVVSNELYLDLIPEDMKADRLNKIYYQIFGMETMDIYLTRNIFNSKTIMISDFSTNGFFWGQTQEEANSAEFRDLFDMINDKEENDHKPLADLKVKWCIAEYCGEWFRAYIDKVLENKKLQVFFFDYGTTAVVDHSSTRLETNDRVWELPPFAIPFVLKDITLTKFSKFKKLQYSFLNVISMRMIEDSFIFEVELMDAKRLNFLTILLVVIIGMLSSSMVSAWGGDGWGWNRRGPNWGRGHGRNWGWGGWNRGRGCGGPRC